MVSFLNACPLKATVFMLGSGPIACSPDGTKVLTGSCDKTAKLWDAATGDCIRTFTGHTRGVYSLAFSPDGTKVLAGGFSGKTRLWDANTGDSIRTFSSHASVVLSVAFSPDGTNVLTGSMDGTARLWWTNGALPIPGDANGDCRVNILDLIFIRGRLNQAVGTGDNWKADLNADGEINVLDLIEVRGKLNTQCP